MNASQAETPYDYWIYRPVGERLLMFHWRLPYSWLEAMTVNDNEYSHAVWQVFLQGVDKKTSEHIAGMDAFSEDWRAKWIEGEDDDDWT